MTAEIFSFQQVKIAAAEDSLSVHEDDFSVRVISSDDPLFWVRLKRTEDQSIVVTDFNGGSLPQFTLNIALRKALRALYCTTPNQLTFKSVFYSYDIVGKQKQNLDVVRTACESIANFSKRSVASFRVLQDNHKVNVVVDIA